VDIFASMQESGIEMREGRAKIRRRARRVDEDEFDLSTISSDDTVGLYLKEMARVPLLTTEQEVDLAKRLERGLLADDRQLIPMREEIALCRQYLNLEHLRLGERLQVHWSIDPEAENALVPPMLLQPLVENAVYHGIEPGLAAGAIEIRIGLDGDRLVVGLSNPYHPEHQHRQGNRMALANIRERLLLHFDVEAKLDTGIDGERYRIGMAMPYRRAP